MTNIEERQSLNIWVVDNPNLKIQLQEPTEIKRYKYLKPDMKEHTMYLKILTQIDQDIF